MTDKTNTPEELLDLVDKDDKIIGTIKKKEANQNPKLLHREVAVIIYDSERKILFQQRSKKKLVNPGVWTESCAGHVPKGITHEKAAHMELKEELGFATKLRFIGKTLASLPNETHFTYWFAGKFPKGVKIKIEPREVDQVKFLSKKELGKLISSGEKYGPKKYGGHSKDMIEELWKQIKTVYNKI